MDSDEDKEGVVDYAYKNVKTLPAPILERAAKATSLLLQRNALTSAALEPLEGMTHLQTLNLSYNYTLKAFPTPVLTLLGLKALHLEHCGIGSLPPSLAACVQLEELALSGNPLGEGGLHVARDLPRLRKLYATECGLVRIGGELQPCLEELRLGENPLHDVASAAGRCRALRVLALPECGLADAAFVAAFTALETLDLARNKLTSLPDAVARFPRLAHLHVDENEGLAALPEPTGPGSPLYPAIAELTARLCPFLALPRAVAAARFRGAVTSSVPDEVLPALFLGSWDCAENLPFLRSRGVRRILQVAAEAEARYPDEFEYRKIDITDDPERDLLAHLPAAVAFLRQPAPARPALVHCAAGVSRSASVAIACALAEHRAPDVPAALALVRAGRPIVDPNPGFIQQLEAFAASLPPPPLPAAPAPAPPSNPAPASSSGPATRATRASPAAPSRPAPASRPAPSKPAAAAGRAPPPARARAAPAAPSKAAAAGPPKAVPAVPKAAAPRAAPAAAWAAPRPPPPAPARPAKGGPPARAPRAAAAASSAPARSPKTGPPSPPAAEPLAVGPDLSTVTSIFGAQATLIV